MNHIIQKFLFRQHNHVESMKTQINMFGIGNNGGSRAILRLYSSWSISNSLYEELSAPTLANNANPHPKPSLVNDVDARLRWPSLMLPSIKEKITGDVVHRFFNPVSKDIISVKTSMNSPVPNKARCFWSSHGWLGFIDPSDCGLYLWNPSSSNPSKDVFRLPSIESLPSILGVKLNDHGSIRKFILEKSLTPRCSEDLTPKKLTDIFMRQLRFSIHPSLSMENNDSIVMAIQGRRSDLAFCKPGGTEWTALDGPLRPYKHVIPSNIDKVFYARSRASSRVEAWDLRDLSSIKRTLIDYECKFTFRIPLPQNKWTDTFLVESSGDLLLVYKCRADCGTSMDCAILDMHDKDGIDNKLAYMTNGFSVYRFDFSQRTWNYVKCLGDHALFVGWSSPFSLRASDYPGLKPNSIYFADCLAPTVHIKKLYVFGGHDMGVFNLEDNSIEHYYPFGHLKTILPSPFWVAPSNPHSNLPLKE